MPLSPDRAQHLAALGCLAAASLLVLVQWWRAAGQPSSRSLEEQLQALQVQLEHEKEKRKAERVGRTRAEQELRAAKVQLQQLQLTAAPAAGTATDSVPHPASASAAQDRASGVQAAAAANGGAASAAPVPAKGLAPAVAALAAASAMPVFPLRPIGHIRSVFTERNGTPRQPQLVPLARCRLELAPSVPAACLEGLAQYSHCWVLYVFHANTDLAKYLSAERSGLKAKIHVPRLNGGRMGVLATRSPHRPSPVGLSTARVLGVEGSTLLLGGADIVDGSPVLDIKPYVPFCDCLTDAVAPPWVKMEAEDEPLAVSRVAMPPSARAALVAAWEARRAHSMYPSSDAFVELVEQVLSRDIRSVHQRINVGPSTTEDAAAAAAAPAPAPRPASTPSPAPDESAASSETSTPRPWQGPQQAAGPDPGKGGSSHATAKAGSATAGGQYHVVLENIFISYDITGGGEVLLRSAWVDGVTAGAPNGGAPVA